MMKLILFVVGIIASIIGALTGVGGGIVLKTFYDLVNAGGVLAIGFYSTVLVFTMCIVSVLKQIKSGFSFDWPFLISISVGSIFGGYIGNSLLNYAAKYIPENTTKLIQSVILLITLIFLVRVILRSNFNLSCNWWRTIKCIFACNYIPFHNETIIYLFNCYSFLLPNNKNYIYYCNWSVYEI